MNLTQYRQLVMMTASLLAVAVPTHSGQCQVVELVADINPGPMSSFPSKLTEFNGELCFTANDGAHGRELWKFDGTSSSLVADINPGPGYFTEGYDFAEFNGNLYVYGYGDVVQGLWKFDGSSISLAAAVEPGAATGGTDLIAFDGNLYFESSDYHGSRLIGAELWKFDGTNASLALDIRPGFDSSYPNDFAVFNGKLYFAARGLGRTGYVLWEFDGSTASIAANVEFPDLFAVFDGNLYFQAENGYAVELWKFDGNTPSIIDIRPVTFGSSPSEFTVFNGALYFSADDGVNGSELWQYDGNTVSLVADINPSQVYPRGSSPAGLTVFNGTLYFSANDGVNGTELWQFDGVTASLAADIKPGPEGSVPRNFGVFDGALYFSADDGVNGAELWRLVPDSDGDGIPDDRDPVPNSDLRPTIIVGQVDSGVVNQLLPEGATVADLVNTAADGPGQSALAYILNELRKEGWITGRDQGAILKASNTR